MSPVRPAQPGLVEIAVMAKAPRAGHSKTRLCPPYTLAQAARLAEAALVDTLASALAVGELLAARGGARSDGRCGGLSARTVVHLDGARGAWLPPGVTVHRQGRGELDERLAEALSHHTGPVLIIGMDTPQLGPAELARALDRLMTPGVDAVLGPARDGGWWGLGLRRPDPALVRGVVCSRPDTGARQLERLRAARLRVARLPLATDVDTAAAAAAAARLAPHTRFARLLVELRQELAA